jgi:TP901 family phage tail tape measure protein
VATAIGDLVILLGAQTTQFDKRMRVARGQVLAMGPATSRMGAQMAGGFATAAAGARLLVASLLPLAAGFGFVRLAAGGEEFNRKMRQSLAIMDDVGESMRENLRDTAFEVARATRFSATEAAEAYFFLFSAGLKAKQALGALPQVAKFAQAGNFDLARATELATGAQAAMGLKSDDAAQNLKNLTRVTDVLVKANKLAQASTEQFAVALGNDAANAARVAGASIEETVALLAVLAEKMIVGEEAGTAIARMFNLLQIQAVKFKGAFEKAGIEVFDKSTGEMTKMVNILVQLEDRFRGMNAEQRTLELMTLGFTKKTVALANAFLGTSGRLGEFIEILNNAAGTVDKVSGNILTPFQDGWKILKAAIDDASAALSKGFGPGLKVIMSGIGDAIAGLTSLASAFGEVADAVQDIALDPTGTVAGAIARVLPGAPDLAAQEEKIARAQRRLDKAARLRARAAAKEEEAEQKAGAGPLAMATDPEKKIDDLRRKLFLLKRGASTTRQEIIRLFVTGEISGKQAAEMTRLTRQISARERGDPLGQIRALRDEFARLTTGITEAQQALRRLQETGAATPEEVAQIGKLQEQIARLKKQAKLDKIGEALSERLRTPVERASQEAARIGRLFQGGSIDAAIRKRALQEQIDELREAQPSEEGGGAAALEKGSSAAFSAIMAASRGGQKTVEKNTGDTAKNTAAMFLTLEEMRDQTPEPFQEIPG